MNDIDIKLLVGLGNPGDKYIGTRHNIGFMALEKFAKRESVDFFQSKKILGQIAQIGFGDDKQVLLMPNTYMNESGKSIKAAMAWFDLEMHQIMVIADDMDLPLGKLRLRRKGGSGGHKGLKSSIAHLGTEDFCRLRIGIGAPSSNPEERKLRTNSHVLGKFTSKEIPLVESVVNQVVLGFDLIKKLGVDSATNQINSYKIEINT